MDAWRIVIKAIGVSGYSHSLELGLFFRGEFHSGLPYGGVNSQYYSECHIYVPLHKQVHSSHNFH